MNKVFTWLALILTGLFLAPSVALAFETPPLLPVADGYYMDWSPKIGNTHFTMVDETVCNGTTDFNVTDTLLERDSYRLDLSSVPNGATISQIQITPCASNKGSGANSSVMDLFYRLNGSNSSLSGNYNLVGTTPIVLNPTLFQLSEVKTSTSTLELGAILTSGKKGVRLGQIVGKLTYTPLFSPSGLTATDASQAALLNWVDNSINELGFKIERSTDSASFAQIATVSANITSYLDGPLEFGQYYYRVRSYNVGAESSPSGVAAVFIP